MEKASFKTAMIQYGGAHLSITVSGRQMQEDIDKLKGSLVYTASAKPQATRRIEKQKQNTTIFFSNAKITYF